MKYKSLPDFNLELALKLLYDFNAIIIDVRTYEEFCKGHLEEAILISTPVPPLSKRETKTLKDHIKYTLKPYDKQTPIIVYCKKGIRAKLAKTILEKLGYIHVTVVGGVEEQPLKQLITGKYPGEYGWNICYCKNIN